MIDIKKEIEKAEYDEVEQKFIEIADELKARFNINDGDLIDIIKDNSNEICIEVNRNYE